MSTAGIAAAIAKRRVRVERFLIVGGRCAARRSDIVGSYFPGLRWRVEDGSAGSWPDGRLARISRPAWPFRPCGRRAAGSTVLGGPTGHHSQGPRDGHMTPTQLAAGEAGHGAGGWAWLTWVNVLPARLRAVARREGDLGVPGHGRAACAGVWRPAEAIAGRGWADPGGAGRGGGPFPAVGQ